MNLAPRRVLPYFSFALAGIGSVSVGHALEVVSGPSLATVTATAGSGVPFSSISNSTTASESTFGDIDAYFSSSSVTPPVDQSFSGFGNASVTGTIDPTLTATSNIEVYSDTYAAVDDASNASAHLTYGFEVVGAASSDVAVTLSSLMSISVDSNLIPAGADGSSYYAQVALNITDYTDLSDSWLGTLNDDNSTGPVNWIDPEYDGTFSGGLDTTLDLDANTMYYVSLAATSEVDAPPQYDLADGIYSYTAPGTYSITASVDPLFTPEAGYTIEFSPNLGPIVSSAPDAADTLALAAVSLFGLAIVHRRFRVARS